MGQGLDRTAIRKDGTKFPVEIGLSFVDTAEGRLAIVLVTDITARKQAEANLEREHEALHRAERLATLDTLAASIAHEINNPIGIIASRTELALTELEGTSLPPTLREDLDVIQRNVERVAQIPTACWPSRTARPASGDPSISTGSLRRRCSSSARSWQDPASRSA
jgi:C4-dicarboxylate-specific signal transduction histidine kinase